MSKQLKVELKFDTVTQLDMLLDNVTAYTHITTFMSFFYVYALLSFSQVFSHSNQHPQLQSLLPTAVSSF